jgi:DNA-3-methyladenine glycosylase I
LQEVNRCPWAGNDPDYCHYHDHEWGEPVHDDRKLLEMLILEGFQAGLSWITILKKRENFRKAFANWDVRKIAAFTSDDVNRLLNDSGIIRNRRKVESAINNARHFIEVQKEFGSFDKYIWQFTNYKTLFPKTPPTTLSEIPTHSPESDAMSKDLQKRGFNFVGTVICYSFMQAVGMVNDHVKGCYKFIKARSNRRMSI